VQSWSLDHSDTAAGAAGPQVVFSTPEARVVVLDLAAGEVMREHRVRERLVVLVMLGAVEVTADGATDVLRAPTLALFDPDEDHAVRAVESSRLLLTLAPWPARGHYHDGEDEDPHDLPDNATLRPRATSPD
jgi:quercetin dioxygenase-like cupin family protein